MLSHSQIFHYLRLENAIVDDLPDPAESVGTVSRIGEFDAVNVFIGVQPGLVKKSFEDIFVHEMDLAVNLR
jgi:hypothetical protein